MKAVRIAVDPAGEPWIVTADHRVYHREERVWHEIGGRATDIAVGPGRSVWAVGAVGERGNGYPVLRWSGGVWVPTAATAVCVAVGPDGLPWTIDAQRVIRRSSGAGQWEELPGRAMDLAVGPEGTAWALGVAEVEGGHPVLRWSGTQWERTDGSGIRISMGADGLPWVVDARCHIRRLTPDREWKELSGRALDVAVGADGSVWAIDAEPSAAGGRATFRGRYRPPTTAGGPPREDEAAFLDHNVPPSLPAGEVRTFWVTLENQGTRTWEAGAFALAVALDGAPVLRVELPHAVGAGERVTLHWVLRTPSQAGRHALRVDMIEKGAAAVAARELPPLHIAFEVTPPVATRTCRLRDLVLDNHARCWLPADGMTWSSTGSGFPQFAQEGRGCRLTDVEGREYVDYLMGWGSALLGYADDRVARALEEAIRSGATLTLTHYLMPEVAEALCAMFPGAEAATFGKNGSDVCTAAVRVARAHTGRPVVLTCGYHGWQDAFVERLGFAATGVPARDAPLLVPFGPGNLDELAALLAANRGRVAAVMLEPAGVLEGTNGPIRDADGAFLEDVVSLAHQDGALVIFDEILTGFRHAGGSVQHATRVVPDLTCLGKALSAGLPLSALIGRRDILAATLGRIHYEPTFKGEVYSFAAARAALRIYREQDIPARVASFGNRLRDMVNEMCDRVDLPAEMIGPPYRMMLVFNDVDGRRRVLMRTLLQQELLKRGVLTSQHLFLPSAAHDDSALHATRHAFEGALAVLADVTARDRFASALEIPPLPG